MWYRDAMRHVSRMLLLACTAAGFAAMMVPTASQSFTIKRYDLVTYAQARADRALAGATEVLQKNDGNADVSADVALTRLGSLGTTATGTGTISSRAEFDALFDSPVGSTRQARIVQAISFCGFAATFLGCADVNGYRIAVVAHTEALEGLLWAHEFGHTKGLRHRDERYAVMRPQIVAENKNLNASEALAVEAVALAGAADEQVPQERPLEPVTAFVRHTFPHGVPFEIARRYPPGVIDTLVGLLRGEEGASLAANIVTVLGATGNRRAYEPIIGVIERGSDDNATDMAFQAKLSALHALGLLANRDSASIAFGYLQDRARPEAWLPPGRTPNRRPAINRASASAAAAAMGVALSGHPGVIGFLQSLRTAVFANDASRAQELTRSAIDEAIRVAEEVRQAGLAEYYRRRR